MYCNISQLTGERVRCKLLNMLYFRQTSCQRKESIGLQIQLNWGNSFNDVSTIIQLEGPPKSELYQKNIVHMDFSHGPKSVISQ